MYLLPFVFSYLIGTISPGFFITKFYKHIDIRKFGEKYTGAANVYKIAGFLPAILTGFIDFTKGVIAISASFLFWEHITPAQYKSYFLLIAAIFTIIGHIFPFYLNFKGGRGAATSYGVLLVSLIMLVYAGYPLSPILWLVFYTLILFFILHSFSFSGFLIDITALIVFYLYFLKSDHYRHSLMVDPKILFYILQISLGIIVLSSIYTYSREKSLRLNLKDTTDTGLRQRIIFYFFLIFISFIPLLQYKVTIPLLSLILIICLSLFFTVGKKKKELYRTYLINAFYFALGLLIVVFFFPDKYHLVIPISFATGYIISDLINRHTGKIFIRNKATLEGLFAFFAFALLAAISLNVNLNLPLIPLITASMLSTVFFYLFNHPSKFLLTPILFGAIITFL